jgi:hypothetical protein
MNWLPDLSPGQWTFFGTLLAALLAALRQTWQNWRDEKGRGPELMIRRIEAQTAELKRKQNVIEAQQQKLEICKERLAKCADDYHDETGSVKHHYGQITPPDEND